MEEEEQGAQCAPAAGALSMASQANDRTRTLLFVLAALVVVALYLNRDLLVSNEKANSANEASVSLGGRFASLKALPAIALDRPVAGADYMRARDLFAFTDSPEALARKAALERRKVEQVEAARKKREARAREQATRALQPRTPPPPRMPPPPDFHYTYVGHIGYLLQPMSRFAVLTKAGTAGKAKKSDMRVVRVGEIIDNDFVVKKIDMDSLTIGYTNPKFREKTKTVKLRLPKVSATSRGAGRRRGGRR